MVEVIGEEIAKSWSVTIDVVTILGKDVVGLIETVADHIIREIKGAFPQVQHVTVKVCKLNPPLDGKTEYVAVQMEG